MTTAKKTATSKKPAAPKAKPNAKAPARPRKKKAAPVVAPVENPEKIVGMVGDPCNDPKTLTPEIQGFCELAEGMPATDDQGDHEDDDERDDEGESTLEDFDDAPAASGGPDADSTK